MTSPDVHKAAVALGRIKTRKKAVASRRNGKLGGRPSSGLCSARELRRRVRIWVHDSLHLHSRLAVSSFQRAALNLRLHALFRRAGAVDYIIQFQQANPESTWISLLPQDPILPLT